MKMKIWRDEWERERKRTEQLRATGWYQTKVFIIGVPEEERDKGKKGDGEEGEPEGEGGKRKKRTESKQERKYIWRDNCWDFSKINVRQNITDSRSSEHPKQD